MGSAGGNQSDELRRLLPEPVPSHPLLDLLVGAAEGRWPPADGMVEVMSSPPGPADAVLAFTAHSIVAADVPPRWVATNLPARDDLTGPMRATFLARLAERLGTPTGSLDVTLTACGRRGSASPHGPRVERAREVDHPRVARARRYRDELQAYVDPAERGLVVLGRGLARRWEVAVELFDRTADAAGVGRDLLLAARAILPPREHLFAAVAPGNARALRAALAAGFRPIGGEVLFLKPGG